MKKLIALMALACMFAAGCKTENKGGTSEGNYSTSGSTMQSQPSSSSSTITTNSSSGTQTQP